MLGSDIRLAQPTMGILAAILISVLFSSGPPAAEAAEVRAGVAVTDITADIAPAEIHDPLHAKALVVESGTSRAVIIALDLIGASESLVSSIRDGVNGKAYEDVLSRFAPAWQAIYEAKALEVLRRLDAR